MDENNFDLKSTTEYKYLYNLPRIYEKYLLRIEEQYCFNKEEKISFLNSFYKMQNVPTLKEKNLNENFDNFFCIYSFAFGNPVQKELQDTNHNTNFIYSNKKVKFKVIKGGKK